MGKKEDKRTVKVKRYLNSAWYWKNRQNYLSDKILKLKSQAEKTTTTYSEAPTFGGYENHRQAVMDEMVDRQAEYNKAVQECKKKTEEIQLFVCQLHDYRERLIIEMRYLFFENWQDIAFKLNYHERAVYKIHGRALLHLLELNSKMIEESGKGVF